MKKTTPNIQQEFTKFWHKLDNLQQISILASSIIALSLFLSFSIINQSELTLLRARASQSNYLSTTDNYNSYDSSSDQLTSDSTDPETEINQIACNASGGNWITFPNSCTNSCAYVLQPEAVMCLNAETKGCDCGPNSCWNGQTCVDTTAP